jgi:hypothetical protein
MEIRDSAVANMVKNSINALHKKGKLSDKSLKDFMKQYYDGDPTSDCPNGCKGNCLLDCYIDIHQSLIGDDGDIHDFKTKYTRDNAYHCCGKHLVKLKDNLYCTVCSNEY